MNAHTAFLLRMTELREQTKGSTKTLTLFCLWVKKPTGTQMGCVQVIHLKLTTLDFAFFGLELTILIMLKI